MRIRDHGVIPLFLLLTACTANIPPPTPTATASLTPTAEPAATATEAASATPEPTATPDPYEPYTIAYLRGRDYGGGEH